MKNSFDITTALNQGVHEFAILSGEKPKEIEIKIVDTQLENNNSKQLLQLKLKLSKSIFYSFQIIQHKQI
jgi:hypothetical protein